MRGVEGLAIARHQECDDDLTPFVISLTDHHVGLYDYPITDTTAFRTPGFTTILGAEMHTGQMSNGELWHFLAVGLPADFERPEVPFFDGANTPETAGQLARRCADAGAFVAIAHPEWSGLSLDDARGIDAAHAVEIYNHGCAVECDRPHGFWHLDRLLEEGRRLTICATDDAHFAGPDAFGGWVMVKAEENEPEALLEALKAGRMYSSTGPQIHDIVVEKKEIHVECSAADRIIISGAGSAAKSIEGTSLTRGSMKLARFTDSGWLRVTVMDAAGRRAWSNPIWKDKIV